MSSLYDEDFDRDFHEQDFGCDGTCDATEILRELVELKRMKDTTGASEEYRRRKALAWRRAFVHFNAPGDPK